MGARPFCRRWIPSFSNDVASLPEPVLPFRVVFFQLFAVEPAFEVLVDCVAAAGAGTPTTALQPLGCFLELASATGVHGKQRQGVDDIERDHPGAIVVELLAEELAAGEAFPGFFRPLVVPHCVGAFRGQGKES